MPVWNADQYLKFGGERTRACSDLAARVALNRVASAIDLGCGPGNSTDVLAQRWPHAELSGLDNSPEMIAAARLTHPALRVAEGEIAEWASQDGRQFDLVFSNAALQWVPDHALVFPRLLARVAPGGALAVQIPAMTDSPVQRIPGEMRLQPPGPVHAWRSHDPAFYYDALAPGASAIDIWETEYQHVMPDAGAIVEWYRGSGLRPYLQAFDAGDERERFLAEFRSRVVAAYPPRADGRVLFPFRRIFIVAYR